MAAIGEFQNNESKRYSENHQDEQLGWGVKPFEMHLRRLKNAIIDMKKEISWESVQTTPYETETGEKFYKIHLYDIPGKAESMKDFLDEGLLYVEEDLTGKKSGAVRNIGRWNRILVLGRNKNEEVLELKKLPQTNIISTSPNIHSERLQTSAINSLKDNQLSSHKPIVKLFYEYDDNTWPTVNIQSVNKWYVLTDKNRKGVDQQRKFVEIALNTPDFAFLEGPPGSGKTTILCELIAQLVSQNKKILVCASTHVAVDNVLERIIKYNSILKEEKIMPIRYGNLKEMPHVVKKWESTNFCNTKKQEFINYLSEIKSKTESQKTFLDLLKQKNNDFDEILQNCANIVCGTTIGINKFLKKNMEFDVMIIDEASKTTFTEFLVPALYAKRWIIVGDIHQLPPYLDERGEVANVIEMAVSSKYKKNAAIDVFNAVNDGQISVIITNDRTVKNTYKNQCGVHDVKYVDLDEFTSDYDHFTIFKELHDAKIIIGSSQSIEKNLSHIPCDATIIRNVDERFGMLERRASSWRKRNKIELKTWGAEISWRMKMIHEENLIQDSRYHRSDSIYQKNMEQLLPVDDIEDVKKNLQYTKMTVLPSFLEFIQQGFQKNKGRFKTVMSDGMPTKAINERHVSLTWQHRMHAEIANFPHVHIYNKKSLHTSDIIKNERIWKNTHYEYRSIWLDVKDKHASEDNHNEAIAIIKEIEKFCDNIMPKSSNEPWQIAILTFYKQQERTIRNKLREHLSNKGIRYFNIKSKNSGNIQIELCTVDRFQGHEADLVFLSMVKQHVTPFLRNLNRLNVAITRARYQNVIVGNNSAFNRGRFITSSLAKELKMQKSMWT